MATNATVKAAVQGSGQGTAATTGFYCGILREIENGIEAEYAEQVYEYSCAGANTRPTSQKSGDTLQVYAPVHTYSGFMYPDLIPIWLRGAGFAVTTTANTPVTGAHSHAFTIEDLANWDWLTVLHAMSDYEHRTVDARVASLAFTDSQTEVSYSVGLVGLLENEATGSETSTNETGARLLQRVSSGDGIAVTAGGELLVETTPVTRPYQSHTFTITNDFTREPGLYTSVYSDLVPKMTVTGTLEGIEIDADMYDVLWRGGIGNTSISQTPVTGSVVYSLESSSYITGTTPYKITVNLASCGFKMGQNARATGGEKIRTNLDYYMIDNTTTPLTITVINGVSSYS